MPSRMLVLVEGVLTFGVGKHAGKTIDRVAEEDLSYLYWLVDKRITESFGDTVFYAFEDYLKRNNISWGTPEAERRKRMKRRSSSKPSA
jgi:hypothetical protein